LKTLILSWYIGDLKGQETRQENYAGALAPLGKNVPGSVMLPTILSNCSHIQTHINHVVGDKIPFVVGVIEK
jgi:hypothetical protein